MRMLNLKAATAVLALATAGTTLAHAQAAAPAAPVASAPGYAAVYDPATAVRESAAFKAADAQIRTQYKAQIDAYSARATPLGNELRGMETEIRNLQNTANTPPATLQARVTAYQTRRQAIENELAPLGAPFQRPFAYVEEQIITRLDQAVRAAMTAKRVTILIRPDAVAGLLPQGNITGDVVTQLNSLVPTVSITPPAGWQPGGQGAAPAAAAAPAAGGVGR